MIFLIIILAALLIISLFGNWSSQCFNKNLREISQIQTEIIKCCDDEIALWKELDAAMLNNVKASESVIAAQEVYIAILERECF